MLKAMYYNSLYRLLKSLLFSQYIKGIIILHVLVFVLASHICILGYPLGPLPNKASLLILLFLSLKMLLLYFILLLSLFKAFGLLLRIILTMLQLGFLLLASTFAFLAPIHLSNIGLTNIVL